MDYSPSKLWLPEHLKSNRKSKLNDNVKVEKKNERTDLDYNPEENGNIWDKISLKAMLAEKCNKLYQGKSQYQDIQVIEAKDIRMYLNEQLQFSSLDERIYHEAFVHIPFALTEKHSRVLILGGGDGLALREVLKYPDVKQVDLVDIDAKVLHVAANVPEMVELNEGAFHDQRVKVHAKDALQFLKNNKKTYDIMIVDFPDPEDDVLASLYTVEVFEKLNNFLTADGIIVCQSNSPEDTPTVYWSIGLTIEHAGLYTKGYHTIVPSFGDWGFYLASKNPIPGKIKKITVPNKTLPKNISTLFHFQDNILSYQQYAIVNTRKNLQLHDIFMREVV